MNCGIFIYDGMLSINENESTSTTLKNMAESQKYVKDKRLGTKEHTGRDPPPTPELKGNTNTTKQ